MSTDELARIIPVSPPIVNISRNPIVHSRGVSIELNEEMIVDIQLKILIPVGIAITMVAAVKYARVSISSPTVNI